MNEIIAAVMLFGVITAVFVPLIADSGSQIFSRSSTIRDSMEDSRIQSGQSAVATHAQQHNGTITVFVSNIGVEDIHIRTVLVDGYESPYVLNDQDGDRTDVLAAGGLGSLGITGTGDRVQAITTAGKLFEFDVSD